MKTLIIAALVFAAALAFSQNNMTQRIGNSGYTNGTDVYQETSGNSGYTNGTDVFQGTSGSFTYTNGTDVYQGASGSFTYFRDNRWNNCTIQQIGDQSYANCH